MGPEEESGSFLVAAFAAWGIGGRLEEHQHALFFLMSLYPSAQGSQAHKQQPSSLDFTSAHSLGCWQLWGLTEALSSKSP